MTAEEQILLAEALNIASLETSFVVSALPTARPLSTETKVQFRELANDSVILDRPPAVTHALQDLLAQADGDRPKNTQALKADVRAISGDDYAQTGPALEDLIRKFAAPHDHASALKQDFQALLSAFANAYIDEAPFPVMPQPVSKPSGKAPAPKAAPSPR